MVNSRLFPSSRELVILYQQEFTLFLQHMAHFSSQKFHTYCSTEANLQVSVSFLEGTLSEWPGQVTPNATGNIKVSVRLPRDSENGVPATTNSTDP